VLWAGKGFQTWHYLAHWGIPAGSKELFATAEQCAQAISRLNIIGMPRSGDLAKHPDFRPKLEAAFDLWDISPRDNAVEADSMVCFYMIFDFWLWGLIQRRRVVIVNNGAEALKAALEAESLPPQFAPYVPAKTNTWQTEAVLAVTLEPGLAGSQKALDDIEKANFKPDIALLGCGSRVVHLATEIAERYSIPAIDLGCVCTELHNYGKDDGGWAKIHKWYQDWG
jgi:hypothetical protein